MSDSKKYPFAQAIVVAETLLKKLEPHCEKIVIAGSLRRRKDFVGDIELLLIPKSGERQKPGDMFATETVDFADIKLNVLLGCEIIEKRPNVNGVFMWGKSNKYAIHKDSGIPVDFFFTTPEKWWVALVVRTGSAEMNLKLTSGAIKLGRSLNAYGCGVTDTKTGKVTAATSERNVFELCGVQYREAALR